MRAWAGAVAVGLAAFGAGRATAPRGAQVWREYDGHTWAQFAPREKQAYVAGFLSGAGVSDALALAGASADSGALHREGTAMKRMPKVLLGLLVALPTLAAAQGLTMQMSNGWKFSFSGNVNVFAVFSADANSGQKNFNIRTGLLPGFAVFDAKGHEGNYDLGVHVGFAPQIQNGGQEHDVVGGAQIDMRQLYLTIGRKNGSTILAGRELGVFQRQNILNDMTLNGTGALGPVQGGGTTLGRIGYGYTYPNFNAQITYSSSAAKPTQFTVGLFQPSVTPFNGETELPRVEAEVTHAMKRGGGKSAMVWVGGEWQTTKTAPTGGTSLSAIGVAGGIRA